MCGSTSPDRLRVGGSRQDAQDAQDERQSTGILSILYILSNTEAVDGPAT